MINPLFDQQIIQSKTTLSDIYKLPLQHDEREPLFQNDDPMGSQLGPSAPKKGPEKSELLRPFLK